MARRPITRPDGSGGLELSLDLALAPVPDRRYVAEVGSVTYDGGVVQLLFGQKKIGLSGGLRSLIVIQMTTTAVHNFLRTLDSVDPNFRIWLDLNDVHSQLMNIQEEPDQTVTLFANTVGLASAGRESCIDFYHASAFSLHYAQQNKKLAVDPVVRVILGSGLLIAMLDKLRELEPRLPVDAERGHGNE
jgi:hypothetical protein